MPGVLSALLAALLQLAVGTLIAALVTDRRDEVARGFLALAAATALAVALLAFGLGGLARVGGTERFVQGGLAASLLGFSLLVLGADRSIRLLAGAAAALLGIGAL